MKGLLAGISGLSRRGRLLAAGAFAGAAFLLAPDGLVAEALARPQKARADMAPGSADNGTATGRMEVRRDRRGDQLRLTMNNLEPRTQYDVRDAATRDRLAGFRTNRSGRGRARLKDAALTGLNVEICRPGSDESVLEGQVPGDDEFNGMFDRMSFRTGSLSTAWDAAVQVSINLSSFGDPASEEGTVESIDLTVYGGDVTGPVTLWIADDEGVLQNVASVEPFDWSDPLPLPGDDDGMEGDPSAGEQSLKSRGGRGRRAFFKNLAADGSTGRNCPSRGGDGTDATGDGTENSWGEWGGEWTGSDAFFSWYADNTTDPGLPFGLTSASDLSGRACEVRDGDGNVLLSGDLPALEEFSFEPMPMPDPSGWGNWDINIDIDIDISIDWGTVDGQIPAELADFLNRLLGEGWDR